MNNLTLLRKKEIEFLIKTNGVYKHHQNDQINSSINWKVLYQFLVANSGFMIKSGNVLFRICEGWGVIYIFRRTGHLASWIVVDS